MAGAPDQHISKRAKLVHGLVGQLAEDDGNNNLKWQYRRCIAKDIGIDAAHKECEFAAKILSEDPTNYLAWSHRQWVLRALGGSLKDELDYCQEILEKDPFNSFAWNQRWTLITEHCPAGDIENMKLLETNKAMSAIEDKPENNCPWAYLRRLHKKDIKSLFRLAVSVQNVLLNLVDRAKALSKGADLDLWCLNKIGCMHALKLIFELMNLRYKPTTGMENVIEVLYPKYGPSGLGYADKVRVIMESLDYYGIFGLPE